MEQRRVVLEQAESSVARTAQQLAQRTGLVVMVYGEPIHPIRPSANRADRLSSADGAYLRAVDPEPIRRLILVEPLLVLSDVRAVAVAMMLAPNRPTASADPLLVRRVIRTLAAPFFFSRLHCTMLPAPMGAGAPVPCMPPV